MMGSIFFWLMLLPFVFAIALGYITGLTMDDRVWWACLIPFNLVCTGAYFITKD